MMSTEEETDNEVCSICVQSNFLHLVGTRCLRHSKFILRLPTDEQKAAAAKAEAEFAIKAAESMRSIIELYELDVTKDDVIEVALDHVRQTFSECAETFEAFDDTIGETPKDSARAKELIEELVAESVPRDDHEDLLKLFGMNEFEISCLTDTERYSPVKLMVNRLRVLAPEVLDKNQRTPKPKRTKKGKR